MHNIKKIIAAILMLVMVFSGAGYAGDGGRSKDTAPVDKGLYLYSAQLPDKVLDFANSQFNFLLEGIKQNPQMFGFEEVEMSGLYMGGGFNIFAVVNGEEKVNGIYYFPVLYQEKVKAVLTVITNEDGTLAATLGKDFSQNLEKLAAYNSKAFPFALRSNDQGQIVAASKHITLTLSEAFIGEKKSDAGRVRKYYKGKKIINIREPDMAMMDAKLEARKGTDTEKPKAFSLSPYGKSLKVSIVSQRMASGAKRGMCWAASVACIANFRTGKALTAQKVCDDMNMGYDKGATDIQTAAAFKKYGLDANVRAVLKYPAIIKYIDTQKPIYMGATNRYRTYSHATVICGYTNSSQGVALTIMDPWEESLKQCYQSGDTFYYSSRNIMMYWDGTVTVE